MLSDHQATAVERSREVVELEGRLEAAEAREREARTPIEVSPLPPRIERRRGSQDWGMQAAAIAAVAVVLVVLALIIL